MNKISIIYPCHGRFHLTQQTLPPLAKTTGIKLIIISDCNTIEYDEFLSRYADILVIHQKREGLRNSIIDGISHASGEYIQKIDNDILFPDIEKWFKYAINMVEQYPLITPSISTNNMEDQDPAVTTSPNGIFFIRKPRILPFKRKSVGDRFTAAHFHQQELGLSPMARSTLFSFEHLG